jgi:exo-beta-1,3-glucanase (GH17 family)
MTYSPYTDTGSCKGASDVTKDIQAIKAAGFSSVRIYSTDCSGLVNVGSACEAAGLKMILGVFINSAGLSAAQTQVSDIVSWGKFELVELIVIGKHALLIFCVMFGSIFGFSPGSLPYSPNHIHTPSRLE